MSVRVFPGAKNPTHEISLSDGVHTWGLRLDGGPQAIQETPMTPSTIHIAGGASKFGDWEPGLAQIGQHTWVGGRGLADFTQDNTRYLDGHMAFTMVEGKLFPAPQWKMAEGLRESYGHVPGDMSWQVLLGDKRYISVDFTTGAAMFDAQQGYLWLRRVGQPGPLTLSMFTDDGDAPGTVIEGGSGYATVLTVTDVVSEWFAFDLSTAGSLTASTKYHLVASGASSDNASNHWQVGVDIQSYGSLVSAEGESWQSSQFRLYHRLVTSELPRRFHFFTLRGTLYAVDQPQGSTASKLYINGDRGKATSASPDTLVDINQAWNTAEWVDAWVRIIAGTGKGQQHQILANTATTISVADWDTEPSTDSLYVIYATERWQEISPTSGDQLDVPVKCVLVAGDEAWFARGDVEPILRMRWNESGGPPAHEFDDDGTNGADILYGFSDATNEYQIWRARNSNVTVSRDSKPNWGTAATFGSDISVGDASAEIINLYDYDGSLFVFKEDGLYQVNEDKAMRQDTGLEFIRSDNTGQAVTNRNFFMYFSWGGYALQQLQKNNAQVDMRSVGPDKEQGLPDVRRGRVSTLGFHPNGLFAAVDAGEDGFSSVLVRGDPSGWHEVFRAPRAGQRIRALHWQDNPGTFPRLWIDLGEDIAYQDWPRHTFNPLQDEGLSYQHECNLIMADVDMGAIRLPKYIKELSLLSENLQSGVDVQVDYQLDQDIGTSRWLNAGAAYRSPEDVIAIHKGDVRKVRVRLRLLTEYADIPPVVLASVLEGFARTPLKYQWNLRIKVTDTQRDLAGVGTDHDPDRFLDWLKGAAGNARKVLMHSIWEQLDGKYVIVEPPSTLREFTNNVLGFWGGSVVITVREV